MTIRAGEMLIEKSAGGVCAVCKCKIPPGPAVQLSSHTNRIRHVECVPKSDIRDVHMGRKSPRKKLPE